jgi:hypothetical protein
MFQCRSVRLLTLGLRSQRPHIQVSPAATFGQERPLIHGENPVDRLSAPLRFQKRSPDQNSDAKRDPQNDQWLRLHLGAHTPDCTIAVARAHLHSLAPPFTKTLHHVAQDGGQRVTDLLKRCSSRGGAAMSSNTADVFEFLFNGAEMPLYGRNIWSKFGGAVLKHSRFPSLKARTSQTETVQRTVGSGNYSQGIGRKR